jgi:hypothetical protein
MKKYFYILTLSLILTTNSYAQDVAKGSSSTGQLSAICILNTDTKPLFMGNNAVGVRYSSDESSRAHDSHKNISGFPGAVQLTRPVFLAKQSELSTRF